MPKPTDLTEYEREAVARDAAVGMGMLLDTVQRIKIEAALAAVPARDDLAAKVEALAEEWDAIADDEGYSLLTRATCGSHAEALRALGMVQRSERAGR